MNPKTLKLYHPKLATELIVDASPVGLGAVLTQKVANGGINTVAYASRALSPVEMRYPQKDREALAIIWAAENF